MFCFSLQHLDTRHFSSFVSAVTVCDRDCKLNSKIVALASHHWFVAYYGHANQLAVHRRSQWKRLPTSHWLAVLLTSRWSRSVCPVFPVEAAVLLPVHTVAGGAILKSCSKGKKRLNKHRMHLVALCWIYWCLYFCLRSL